MLLNHYKYSLKCLRARSSAQVELKVASLEPEPLTGRAKVFLLRQVLQLNTGTTPAFTIRKLLSDTAFKINCDCSQLRAAPLRISAPAPQPQD